MFLNNPAVSLLHFAPSGQNRPPKGWDLLVRLAPKWFPGIRYIWIYIYSHLFGTYHFPPCRDVPKPGPDPLPTLGCPGDPALPRGGRSGAEREERTRGSRVEGLGAAAEKTGATLIPGDVGQRRASGEVKTAATHLSAQTRKLGKKPEQL